MIKINKDHFEEKRSSIKALNLQYDKTYLTFQDVLNKGNKFSSMEKIQDIYAYTKFMINLNPKSKRLEPQGKREGIMFIGTNPSERSQLKDLWKDPYGIYFGEFLREAGIDPLEVWVTNLYKYPTENNRPLTLEEISDGKLELLYEIQYVNPKIIILLGKQAMEVFNAKLYEFTEYKKYKTLGMLHPSYVNRMQGQIKEEFIKQLKKIKLWLQ